MAVITVSDLSKTYRYHEKESGLRGSLKNLFRRRSLERRAVEHISFSIAAGEIVGFLGPNGAGKTTTLKLLCGLLYPSSGSVSVLGYTPARREPAYLRQIALVMGQKSMLWWDLPAMETLLLHKDIYRLPDSIFRRTVDELASLLEVGDLLRVPVRKLSLGERMKLELLAALVHRPAILFLDEPTIGLDVVAQQRVRDFLRDLNREHGTTILLTSHYMADIEALCPRVMVIDRGWLRFDGARTSLVVQATPHKLLNVVFAEPISLGAVTAAFPELTIQPADDPRHVSLQVPREAAAYVAGRLADLGPVLDLSIAEVPLETIMRDVFAPASAERSRQ